MINKNNYHIYAIDYIEGILPPELKAEYEKFLDNNPQIKQEIDELKEFTIPKSKASLDLADKLNLKKSTINGLPYFDQLCIAEIENTITPRQRKELYNLIAKSDEHKKIFEQYKLTKLQPPTAFYPDKQKLKKAPASYKLVKTFISIAAILLITLSIINLKSLQPTIQNLSGQQTLTITYPGWKPITYPQKNQKLITNNQKTTSQNKTKPSTPLITKNTTIAKTKTIQSNLPKDLTFTIPKLSLTTGKTPQIALNYTVLHIYNNTTASIPKNNFNKTTAIVQNLKSNLSKNLRTFAYKKASMFTHRGLRIKIKNKVYGFYVSR